MKITKITRHADRWTDGELNERLENNSPHDGQLNEQLENNSPKGWTPDEDSNKQLENNSPRDGWMGWNGMES